MSAASKPWLSERIPPLTSDSADDICLKKEGALCVIYVAKDAATFKSSEKETKELYQTGQQFASKISRGINFYFMWVDASAEPAFTEMFGLKADDLPKLVILNPGKRKRFLLHDKNINESDVSATLDRILGGDAKFTNIAGNKLADLVSKYPQEATK